MNVKSFFSDVLGFGLASFLTKGVALLVVPILTRNLNPSAYGVLELLIGLGGIMTVLLSMSLESYLARAWGDLDKLADKSQVLSTLLLVTMLVGSIGLLGIWLLSQQIAVALFDIAAHGHAVLFICASAYLSSIVGLPLMVLRVDRRTRPFLAVVSSQSASYLILIFWLLDSNNISIQNIVLSTLLSTAFSLCMAIYFVGQYLKPVFDFATLKPALRYGLPLLPAVGVTWANTQVDNYALLYFFDSSIVGEFSVLTKVTAVVSMGVIVFRQAWLPYSYALARRPDRGVEQFKQVHTAYYIIGLTGSFLLVYFAVPILRFLAPSSYNLVYGVLPVLLLASIVYGSASIVNVGTMVSGKTEWNSYASLLGITLNILLTITLVPLFGIAGAAWGTLVASFVFMLVLSWRSNKLLAINFPQTRIFALSGAYLLCAFAVL